MPDMKRKPDPDRRLAQSKCNPARKTLVHRRAQEHGFSITQVCEIVSAAGVDVSPQQVSMALHRQDRDLSDDAKAAFQLLLGVPAEWWTRRKSHRN